MNRREPRRMHRTLIASLLLHALLLAFVMWKAANAPVAPLRSKPLEIDLVMVPPKVEPSVPAPVVQPPAPVSPKRRQATASAQKPSKSAAPSEQVATAPSTTSPVGEQADSPRNGSTFLVPRVGTMLPGLGAGDESEAEGHTTRNGPGEEPDVHAVREYTAERVKARLDNELGELVAAAQRADGLVNPYFTHLQEDLRAGFVGVDVKLTRRSAGKMVKEEVIDSYTGPASQFAKTGNPMADNEQARQFNDSSFGRLLERGGQQMGDAHDQRMLQAGMQTMAFTQIMKDSVSRPRLKTVLMLRQDGDGALAETTVLEHSGDSEFDEFVVHQARKVVRDSGDTSEKGGAPSALGWSSVWQFTWEPPEVKVKLLRVVKPSKRLQLQ